MRITLRALLAMQTAIESTMDELTHSLKYASFTEARKLQRKARQALAETLDQMIGTGQGG